jgi:hypothetical protein
MLLDDYLPEFDVRTSYATRIVASPARVYASLWTANFDHWGVTRALYAVRTLPSFPVRPHETWRRFRDELFCRRFILDRMLSEGFALLEERPGAELVLGTVGRFWRARGELCAVSPAQFRAPPLREPRRRHGTSKWVYGRTAPRSLRPRLEYCARTSRQGGTFARTGC